MSTVNTVKYVKGKDGDKQLTRRELKNLKRIEHAKMLTEQKLKVIITIYNKMDLILSINRKK